MGRPPSGPTRKRPLPLGAAYGLPEPGPVVLLTTAHHGRFNVMRPSWHTMMEFEPPRVGCVVSEANHSVQALIKTRECVISIPTVELTHAIIGCDNTSGPTLDKFAAFGLTPVPGTRVAAPRITECRADLECPVVDARGKSRYNFFVLQVLAAWYRPPRALHHLGRGQFMIAGRTRKVSSRMRRAPRREREHSDELPRNTGAPMVRIPRLFRA